MKEVETQKAINERKKPVRIYLIGNDKKDFRPLKQIIADEIMVIRKVTQ